jgi:hypothetical protein
VEDHVTRLKSQDKAGSAGTFRANFQYVEPPVLQTTFQTQQKHPQLTMTEADAIVTETSLEALPKIATGKVRDLYEIDSKTLLFVASDRISAYDVIMDNVRVVQVNSAQNY